MNNLNISIGIADINKKANNLNIDTNTNTIDINKKTNNPSLGTNIANMNKKIDNISISIIQKSRQVKHKNKTIISKSKQ